MTGAETPDSGMSAIPQSTGEVDVPHQTETGSASATGRVSAGLTGLRGDPSASPRPEEAAGDKPGERDNAVSPEEQDGSTTAATGGSVVDRVTTGTGGDVGGSISGTG
jgi:hypothetical protein